MREDILLEFDKYSVPNNYYDSFYDSYMVLSEPRYLVFFMVLLWFPISLQFLHSSLHFNYGWCS